MAASTIMVILYKRGTGSSQIELVKSQNATWMASRRLLLQKLARVDAHAYSILEKTPFSLWEATNGFGDEFTVLYAEVTERQVESWGETHAFSLIASLMGDVSNELRFIAVKVRESDVPDLIDVPLNLCNAGEVAAVALQSIQVNVQYLGPASAVDRAHTALLGYIKGICAIEKIQLPNDCGLEEAFARLKEHRAFAEAPNSEDTNKILRSLAKAIAVLNFSRNTKSLAHLPNELLDEPEALLAINAALTILIYLDRKCRRC